MSAVATATGPRVGTLVAYVGALGPHRYLGVLACDPTRGESGTDGDGRTYVYAPASDVMPWHAVTETTPGHWTAVASTHTAGPWAAVVNGRSVAYCGTRTAARNSAYRHALVSAWHEQHTTTEG